MAKLYPDYETIISSRPPPTEGEITMVDFLIANLDDQYEIYVQPFLNGDQPDIILMRKGGGVLIIEVKDWNLNSYKINEYSKWTVNTNGSQIGSPISQVLKYKDNLYNLHIQELKELKLKDFKYWFVVNCSIYFHKENYSRITDFFEHPYKQKLLQLQMESAPKEVMEKALEREKKTSTFLNKNIIFFGRDNLCEKDINEVLDQTWLSRKSTYFTDDLYESFKRYLLPSFHSTEDGKNYKLNKKQIQLSISKTGVDKIKGVAGSGKTLVLANRAVNAHKRTNSKVLILTYNISLKNYIHDKISNVREDFYWENFHIINYHDLINSTINNANIVFEMPSGFDDLENSQKGDFLNKNYYGNVDIFERNENKISKYHTILIDEVQDFKTNWLIIIKKYFLEPEGEFVVFGDGKQDIYNRVSIVENKKVLTIPESPGRWNELNESFRFTPTLTAFAQSFQSRFLSEKHSLDTFENFEFQTSVFDKVYYKFFESLSYEEIASFINSHSKKINRHPNDICILGTSVDVIREIDYEFRKMSNEKSYITSETRELYDELKSKKLSKNTFDKEIGNIRKNKKLHFWMNSTVTKFSTIHSFKGWEIKTLFLIIQKDTFRTTSKELIYTGLTRCMNNLIIININDLELVEFMDKLPYVEKLN